MNITLADTVSINNKDVAEIYIGDERVFKYIDMSVTANKEFILTNETVTLTVNCEQLPNTSLELFKEINMTRTSLGTQTTNSSGVATWTYTGDGSGSVGFVAVYDGKTSNTVTVDDYTPATTSITLTGGGSSSQGATVNLVATLKDQHSQNMPAGVTVTFYDGSTSIGTATSVSGGTATLSKSDFSVGTHTIKAVVGSVESSTVTVTITLPVWDDMSLEKTAGKQILSYVDKTSGSGNTEYCTLTAQLKANGSASATANVPVVFAVMLDGQAYSTETVNTDSNGQATWTYVSDGLGDIDIEVTPDNRTLLTKTFAIEDCWVSNDCTTNSVENIWSIPSNVKSSSVYGFSSNGWKFGSVSTYTGISYLLTLPSVPFEISFKINSMLNCGLQVNIQGSSHYVTTNCGGGTLIRIDERTGNTLTVGHTYRIRVYSDKIELYDENTLIDTYTGTIGTPTCDLATGNNRNMTMKDFKIKPL